MITQLAIVSPGRELQAWIEFEDDPTQGNYLTSVAAVTGLENQLLVIACTERRAVRGLTLFEIQTLVQVLKGCPITLKEEPLHRTDITMKGHIFESVTYLATMVKERVGPAPADDETRGLSHPAKGDQQGSTTE